MKISNKTVVQYHYILTDAAGVQLQATYGSEPLVYLHGAGNIIEGIEKAMEGKSKGDKFSVTLSPEEGFGLRQENAVERIPVKHLRGAKKWKAGMLASVETHHGFRQVTILKVGKFMADVDVNHPYAGKTLNYQIEVMGVRDATPEEIAHKHVHGVGGHHH